MSTHHAERYQDPVMWGKRTATRPLCLTGDAHDQGVAENKHQHVDCPRCLAILSKAEAKGITPVAARDNLLHQNDNPNLKWWEREIA
jgi:endogenous inhibitor of DNA gyrase (YacG/DUF329 family)